MAPSVVPLAFIGLLVSGPGAQAAPVAAAQGAGAASSQQATAAPVGVAGWGTPPMSLSKATSGAAVGASMAQAPSQSALASREPQTVAAAVTTAAVPSSPNPYSHVVPDEPDSVADACLANPQAADAGGLTLNRYVWCQKSTFYAAAGTASSIPGEVGNYGAVTLNYSAVAYGRNDGKRGVTVFLKGGAYTIDPPLKGNRFKPTSRVDLRVLCETLACEDSSEPFAGFQLAQWQNQWTRWDIGATEDGSGTDKVATLSWRFEGQITDAFGERFTEANQPASHRERCDSATYFGRVEYGKACVHQDVTPNLRYYTGDPGETEVAEHIKCAFDSANCVTYPNPEVKAKAIPGDYRKAPDPSFALHRLSPQSPLVAANRGVSTAACRQLPNSLRPVTPGQQCDEFPFASVAEGAANPNLDYSVRAVPAKVNLCAGNSLKRFYRADRILRNESPDDFYVNIIEGPPPVPIECQPDADVTNGEVLDLNFDLVSDWTFAGDQQTTPPPVNTPPTASAGPDASGVEGDDIVLAGSASDAESTVSVRWRYAAVSGVDPGAECTFGGTTRARTTINCTDDGVYRATLTASDGSSSVSSSATVTVRNAAPVFTDDGLTSPQPWQAYRAGAAVKLAAQFEDAGANDTHTCSTIWDDGATTQYPAKSRNCTAEHTFAKPGIYTIRSTAIDDDGGRSTSPSTVLIAVYDRAHGVAADAKGTYTSPPGAITASPAATGLGTFLVKASYLPVSDTARPDVGLVDVGVPFMSFGLHSDPLVGTTVDWLVVTQDKRVAMKGTALVNGKSGCGFVVYGWQGDLFKGQPARFRLVAWPLSEGANPSVVPRSKLVYDNLPGGGYDLDDAPPPSIGLGFVQTLFIP